MTGAKVTLTLNGAEVRTATSGADGAYAFDGLAAGRYQVQAAADGFGARATDPVFVGASGRVQVDVTLQLSAIEANVLVTASASPVEASQSGASATVIDAATIAALGNTELLEPLRTAPGVAIVQTGGRGGKTSLFVRGGSANFNKVLVDGTRQRHRR